MISIVFRIPLILTANGRYGQCKQLLTNHANGLTINNTQYIIVLCYRLSFIALNILILWSPTYSANQIYPDTHMTMTYHYNYSLNQCKQQLANNNELIRATCWSSSFEQSMNPNRLWSKIRKWVSKYHFINFVFIIIIYYSKNVLGRRKSIRIDSHFATAMYYLSLCIIIVGWAMSAKSKNSHFPYVCHIDDN